MAEQLGFSEREAIVGDFCLGASLSGIFED